jgi:cytoskeletal protein CcmA (bactofilin family)
MTIFSKTPGAGDRPEQAGLTIIAVGATVVGDLTSEGVIKVEGTVEGAVRGAEQLLVARGGVIRGDVQATELVVGGEIHGGVHGENRVEIQAGALVHGDIRTQRILIADGAKVNGEITMDTADTMPAVPHDSHIR